MEPTFESDCGRIQLYLADCLQVLPTLADESVDVLWTDPPYGHANADGDFLSRRGDIMRDGGDTNAEAIANDSADDMREVVSGMLVEAVRVLKKDCCCCCCCGGGGGGPSPTFAWVAQRMGSATHGFARARVFSLGYLGQVEPRHRLALQTAA